VVPSQRAYWQLWFSRRERLARVMADVCRRLPVPIGGLLDLHLLLPVRDVA
jgi:hypothetical protein